MSVAVICAAAQLIFLFSYPTCCVASLRAGQGGLAVFRITCNC